MDKGHTRKVISFRPKNLELLEFQFPRIRADSGVFFMLERYFGMYFVLGRKKMLENLEHRNQNSKSARIFTRKVMTLQHWVFQL